MQLRILLFLVGVLLFLASRMSARVRAQITREMNITIRSRDGVARSFAFANRRVSSRAGESPDPDVLLTFPNSRTATAVMLAPDAVRKIVRGLGHGEIELTGLPAHVLWFYELVAHYLPWRSFAFALPTTRSPAGLDAGRVERQPAVSALEDWPEAETTRATLDLWRVGQGRERAGRYPEYRHVVRFVDSASGEDHRR